MDYRLFIPTRLTGLARPEELMRLTDVACNLRDQYHLPISAAMVSDIPGFPGVLFLHFSIKASVLFTSGPNTGDRIGHSTEAWGDRPFLVGIAPMEPVKFCSGWRGKGLFHVPSNPNHQDTTMILPTRLFAYLDETEQKQISITNGGRYGILSIPITDQSIQPCLIFVREWNENISLRDWLLGLPKPCFAKFENRIWRNLLHLPAISLLTGRWSCLFNCPGNCSQQKRASQQSCPGGDGFFHPWQSTRQRYPFRSLEKYSFVYGTYMGLGA